MDTQYITIRHCWRGEKVEGVCIEEKYLVKYWNLHISYFHMIIFWEKNHCREKLFKKQLHVADAKIGLME